MALASFPRVVLAHTDEYGMRNRPGKVLVPQPLGLAVAVLVNEVGGVHNDTQAPVKTHQEGLAVVHAIQVGTARLVDYPRPARCYLLHPGDAAHQTCSFSLIPYNTTNTCPHY
jgi:hypothetical protein